MLDLREFETMVDDTCQRILDSDCGITNVNVGSVTRTLVESIVAELDLIQYTVWQAYLSKTIDDAEGQDLDDVVSILSVYRKNATFCEGYVTFSVTEASETDIEIPSGSIVSSVQTMSGQVYEFETIEDAAIYAGKLSCSVKVRSTTAGHIYLQPHQVVVISSSIMGVAEVDNPNDIIGGVDDETDDELRDRAKEALVKMGRGTCEAIRVAVSEIEGVVDCNVYDMRSGIGTVDVFVVSEQIPMPEELLNKIDNTVEETKAAGIKHYIRVPDIKYVDVNITIVSSITYDPKDIAQSLYDYINKMTIGISLIENQIDRMVLNELNDDEADIIHKSPAGNVAADTNEIIRPNSITVNGVKYYERNDEQDNQSNT